jgi:hypothetical protein
MQKMGDDPPHLKNLKDFLKWILKLPEVMDDPSFFKNGVLNDIFVESCEQLERKKASDKKKEKVVCAVVVVNNFVEQIDPNDYPTLNAKQIGLKTDIMERALLSLGLGCDVYKHGIFKFGSARAAQILSKLDKSKCREDQVASFLCSKNNSQIKDVTVYKCLTRALILEPVSSGYIVDKPPMVFEQYL